MLQQQIDWKNLANKKRYAELIRKLSIKFNSDKPLFIIVAPSCEEHFTRTLFDLKNIDLFDLVGKTNLAEIFLIMKECSLFVGNDSGFMHLAAASEFQQLDYLVLAITLNINLMVKKQWQFQVQNHQKN